MTDHVTGQVSQSAADFYEENFVPALFQVWTGPVLEAAQLTSGDRVLDVGCGTGVLARAASAIVGESGRVTGIDRNDGMIETAKRAAPEIEFHTGQAEALPFADASFDAVVSQFALMFFEDRTKGIRDMWRVLKPGGHMAVAVWGSLENTDGYKAVTDIQRDLFGARVASELEAPYSLGNVAELAALFDKAGISGAHVETVPGKATFPSIAAWIELDVKGWTLGDLIGDEGLERLQAEAQRRLQQFVRSDGTVEFNSPAHIVTATKP